MHIVDKEADATLVAAVKGAERLIAFAADRNGALSITMPASLTKQDRQACHNWAESRGLSSASEGAGDARYIVIGRGVATTFGEDLRGFVASMLSVDSALARHWDDILRGFALDAPEGVHLVASVPGRRKGAEADGYGH